MYALAQSAVTVASWGAWAVPATPAPARPASSSRGSGLGASHPYMYYYCLFQSPIFADYERATYFPLFCGSGATCACFSRTSDILWEDNTLGPW